MTINSLPLNETHNITSIADLEDKYFDGIPLHEDEIAALKFFKRYKMMQLQRLKAKGAFGETYQEIKIIENTVDYRFLLNNLKV